MKTRSICTALFAISLASLAQASVDDVLKQLHARGDDLKTLAADVTLKTADTELGDPDWDTRTGTIVVQRTPDADTRVRATFTKRERNKRVDDARKDFVLDGQRLIERDYQEKRQVTRIVRKPGEKLDLFKLGEGPFPLPIGQPPEEVKKEFDVKDAKPADADLALTYIELVPKKGRPIADKFSYVLVGVNKDGWPAVVETLDKNGTQTTRAELTNIRTNADVDAGAFDLEPIGDDWKKFDGSY